MQPKSEALKRIEIAAVEQTVDQAMEYLPESFDISEPKNRKIVRDWMVRVCGVVVHENAESMARAAESAIKEAAALAVDPDFYAHRKKARDRRKALKAELAAATQAQHAPHRRAELEFERIGNTDAKKWN